ncbi:MAG TPA: aspartyl protease family protein, partial [Pyrinomonadaceae bacterium]
ANIIFLRARVNGSRPLWFMLDTGASGSLMDSARARRLGLKYLEKAKLTGMGGTAEGGYYGGANLKLPGVEVFDQKVFTLPLSFMRARVGRQVDGVIGYDLFRLFVVEVDYDARTLSLHDPRTYEYKGDGEVVPFALRNNTPYTTARLELAGHGAFEGKFEIDTGADGLLSINAPFAAKHRLAERLSSKSGTQTGAGAGGETPYFAARVASVALGRFRFEDAIVTVSGDTKGSGADAGSDGQLGGDFFRRFRVVFDYARSRMILEPNRHLDEPFESDMSGLDIVAEGPDLRTFTVNAVTPGSPAAEAGLREEDAILAVDGRPARDFDLDRLAGHFTTAGKEHELTIRRGRETLKVKMKLRRLL